MKLLVGLGNPGSKYEVTRHNAGFLVLDAVAEKCGINLGKTKFKATGGVGTLFGAQVAVIKPLTFMNLSGQAVQEAANFYRIPPEDILVMHDDIDLEAGKVKTRIGGGHGGHNGIRNIIECIGNSSFTRIKLGVGRPTLESRVDVHDWVLGPFSSEELRRLLGPMVDEVLSRLKIALVS